MPFVKKSTLNGESNGFCSQKISGRLDKRQSYKIQTSLQTDTPFFKLMGILLFDGFSLLLALGSHN